MEEGREVQIRERDKRKAVLGRGGREGMQDVWRRDRVIGVRVGNAEVEGRGEGRVGRRYLVGFWGRRKKERNG